MTNCTQTSIIRSLLQKQHSMYVLTILQDFDSVSNLHVGMAVLVKLGKSPFLLINTTMIFYSI